jgi:hypothetical protein
LWTIGQQLLIRKVMKPFTPSKEGASPPKRSRIVDALVSAQKQGATKQAANGADGKAPSDGRKPGASAQKPGTSVRKQGKPGQKPGGSAATKPGATKQGGRSPSPGGAKQTGGKQTTQRSGGKPPPAKTTSALATPPLEVAEPDTSRNDPAAS